MSVRWRSFSSRSPPLRRCDDRFFGWGGDFKSQIHTDPHPALWYHWGPVCRSHPASIPHHPVWSKTWSTAAEARTADMHSRSSKFKCTSFHHSACSLFASKGQGFAYSQKSLAVTVDRVEALLLNRTKTRMRQFMSTRTLSTFPSIFFPFSIMSLVPSERQSRRVGGKFVDRSHRSVGP
jgi:hypothetical protein